MFTGLIKYLHGIFIKHGKMQITRQGDILPDGWMQTVWRHPKSVELQGI